MNNKKENKKWTRKEIIDTLEAMYENNDLDIDSQMFLDNLMGLISGVSYSEDYNTINYNISTIDSVINILETVEEDDDGDILKQIKVLDDLNDFNKKAIKSHENAMKEGENAKKDTKNEQKITRKILY